MGQTDRHKRYRRPDQPKNTEFHCIMYIGHHIAERMFWVVSESPHAPKTSHD